MVTKISKLSRIQDSYQITSKIESLVVYAMPDIPSKFQKDPSITFWVILLTDSQTDKQTKSGKNTTSLAEVITVQCMFIHWDEQKDILMLLVWLQILLVKLVCLSIIEYVGGGDSSPREVFERFAAAPASLYKPAAPSVSDIYMH